MVLKAHTKDMHIHRGLHSTSSGYSHHPRLHRPDALVHIPSLIHPDTHTAHRAHKHKHTHRQEKEGEKKVLKNKKIMVGGQQLLHFSAAVLRRATDVTDILLQAP